ncbi:MAG: hypothetical protein OXH81_07070 [Gemmatimonadetes bacterium]|nr:hypothetical protein [Gemmatimonadota bacterium]
MDIDFEMDLHGVVGGESYKFVVVNVLCIAAETELVFPDEEHSMPEPFYLKEQTLNEIIDRQFHRTGAERQRRCRTAA